jgi:hypothetical protein
MARLKDILEPGEALVLRGPSRRWQPVWAVLLIFVALMIYHGAEVYLGRSWTLFFSALSLGTAATYPLAAFTRWRVFVTDRRLLVRNKALRWRMDEMRIDEIEDVHHDIPANAIVVRGGGREIRFDPDLVELPALKQALGREPEEAPA